MSVTIDLTPQEQTWVDSQAVRHGQSPAEIIHRMIGERLSLNGMFTRRTPQERIAAMDALAEAHRNAPALPDEAFNREGIYEDRL